VGSEMCIRDSTRDCSRLENIFLMPGIHIQGPPPWEMKYVGKGCCMNWVPFWLLTEVFRALFGSQRIARLIYPLDWSK